MAIMVPRTRTTYEEFEMVALPEDVPELGVEAGTTGTIVTVYEGGRMLLVEIGREDGTSAGFVDLEVARTAPSASSLIHPSVPDSRHEGRVTSARRPTSKTRHI